MSISPSYYKPTKLKVGKLGINVSDPTNNSLNLPDSEYLIVGEHNTNDNYVANNYSLIVDSEGLAVNYSLTDRRNNPDNYAVQLRGNTYIDGNLILTGVITGEDTSNISGGSSNFWKYSGNNNIYYDGHVTIGNYSDSSNSAYSLNISENANYSIDKAQLAIQNRQQSDLRIGVLGSTSNSPVIVNTLANNSIEFHVNRDKQFFDTIYNRHSNVNTDEWVWELLPGEPLYHYADEEPHLNIDRNGNVGIHTSYNHNISYNLRKRNPSVPDEIIYPDINGPMKLHVQGPMYASNILMYDYESESIQNIDELYVRRLGATIFACNVNPGDFAMGNYNFLSNVDIQNDLTVNGMTYMTSNLVIDGNITATNINIHNNGSFSNNIEVQNNLYFKGSIFKQRYNAELGSNEWAMIDLSSNIFVEAPTSSNIYNLGQGIATIGRLGVGVDPARDEVNHQETIVKRDSTYFELELLDKSQYGLTKGLYVGHPSVSADYIHDASTVFLTPGFSDQNYSTIYPYAHQNMYFYPGWTTSSKTLSQFEITSNNIPTFGIFESNRVGIKTLSPTHELDVNGDIAVTGDYYVKRSGQLQPYKIGIWTANNYSYVIGGVPGTFDGIQYNDTSAPHVGINTTPQVSYGLTVSGKVYSPDGYYDNTGYKIAPFYDATQVFDQGPLSYRYLHTNGRVGIGLMPTATLDISDNNANSTTKLRLTQNIYSRYVTQEFVATNTSYVFRLNNNNKSFELFESSSASDISNSSTNRPLIVNRLSDPTRKYQMIINSNEAYGIGNTDTTLLVNGNVKVQGDMDISGSYSVSGNQIVISGSSAVYTPTSGATDSNIYISADDIHFNVNTNSSALGSIFVGYGTAIPTGSRKIDTNTEKSMIYVLQQNSSAKFYTKYDTNGSTGLIKYENNSINQSVYGVTASHNVYIGKNITTPYLTFDNDGHMGIGTSTSASSLFVYSTKPVTNKVGRFTRDRGATVDSSDFVSDITLEKITNTSDKRSWTIQGPNYAYRQKLQLMYSETISDVSSTPSEKFTFTNNSCIGIGSTTPTYAIDIARLGDEGGIRMYQSDPYIAKPQLLFQSGSSTYGADTHTDYRMYSSSNNFYLDMQDSIIGRKVLYHFTSNNSMGILQEADDNYSVTLNGSINITDSIYLNGRPFFSVGNTQANQGTFVTGNSLFLNPNVPSYGGVTINGNVASSNIFQVNSGLNGNMTVFNSVFNESQIHFRNNISPTATPDRRIWRLAASNESFAMEYRSNVTEDLYITDDHIGYSKAIDWTQTATPGEFTQNLRGSIQLSSTHPTITFTDSLTIGGSNQNGYIITPNLGIGTTTPTNFVDIYNTTDLISLNISHQVQEGTSDVLSIEGYNFSNEDASKFSISVTEKGKFVIGEAMDARMSITENSNLTVLALNQSNITGDILQLYNRSELKSVFNEDGNLGIGTSSPTASLHIAGKSYLELPPSSSEYALQVSGLADFGSNIYARANLDVYGDLHAHGNFINDSDRRLKYDILPIESALTKIKKISGYTFNKLNSDKRQTGVIAQELETVLPEAVFTNDDGMLGVAYGNVIGLLIEGIKELSEKLDNIKERLE